MPGVVVTDDMVSRAQAALVRGCRPGYPSDTWVLARAVIDAALKPPEDRACLCGCPHERTGKGQFFEDACRVRYWKERTGYVDPRRETDRSDTNGANGNEASDLAPSRPGGLQVSFRRAVQVIATSGPFVVTSRSREAAEERATNLLRGVLSDKQRARLDSSDV